MSRILRPSPNAQAACASVRRAIGRLGAATALLAGGLVSGACGPPAQGLTSEPTPSPVALAATPTVAPYPGATVAPVATSGPPTQPRTVVALDAGHGGPDDDLPRFDRAGRLMPWYREGYNSGVIRRYNDGTELREKDLTLRLTLAAAEILEARDVAVVLTRREDLPVNVEDRDYNDDGKVDLTDDLLARVDLVNQSRADLLVSIHVNAHPSPYLRGTYTQYTGGRAFSAESVRLALTVHDRIMRGLTELGVEPVSRGVEEDNQDDPTGRHLVLLGPKTDRAPLETTIPGALVETLFLTNPDDAELLRREDALDALAQGIAEGILEYLGR